MSGSQIAGDGVGASSRGYAFFRGGDSSNGVGGNCECTPAKSGSSIASNGLGAAQRGIEVKSGSTKASHGVGASCSSDQGVLYPAARIRDASDVVDRTNLNFRKSDE